MSNEEIICPVCGYYCLGNGGNGCIDKPKLVGSVIDHSVQIKTRKEVVKFICEQLLTNERIEHKKGRFHYGRYELSNLLDYIYQSTPESKDETINCRNKF